MIAELTHLEPGVAYVLDQGSLGARPACPRCPWRSNVGVVPGSYKWRQWVALVLRRHQCTADRETS